MTCPHHWQIAAVDEADNPGDGLPGTCKHCGATRLFAPPWYEFDDARDVSKRLTNLGRVRDPGTSWRDRDANGWDSARHAQFTPRARHGTYTLFGDPREG